ADLLLAVLLRLLLAGRLLTLADLASELHLLEREADARRLAEAVAERTAQLERYAGGRQAADHRLDRIGRSTRSGVGPAPPGWRRRRLLDRGGLAAAERVAGVGVDRVGAVAADRRVGGEVARRDRVVAVGAVDRVDRVISGQRVAVRAAGHVLDVRDRVHAGAA